MQALQALLHAAIGLWWLWFVGALVVGGLLQWRAERRIRREQRARRAQQGEQGATHGDR